MAAAGTTTALLLHKGSTNRLWDAGQFKAQCAQVAQQQMPQVIDAAL